MIDIPASDLLIQLDPDSVRRYLQGHFRAGQSWSILTHELYGI